MLSVFLNLISILFFSTWYVIFINIVVQVCSICSIPSGIEALALTTLLAVLSLSLQVDKGEEKMRQLERKLKQSATENDGLNEHSTYLNRELER